MMSRRALYVMAVVAAAGCASQKAAAPAPAAPAPPPAAPSTDAGPQAPAKKMIDVQELLARELKPLAKQKIQAADVGLSGEVEAVAAPQVSKQDKVTMIEIPVGTQAAIQCFVHPEEIDAGGTVAQLLREAGKQVDLQEVRTAAIHVVKDSPVVFVRAVYLDKPTHSLVGEYKIAVYPDSTTPVFCAHDEAGYSESFQRIVEGFVGSLKRAGATTPTPRMVEIHLTTVDGHLIGFERRETVDVKKGESTSEQTSCMLLPRSATELMTDDTIDIQQYDAKRRVVEQKHVKSVNGEVTTVLSAKRKGAEYVVTGKADGKEVSATFKPADRAGLASRPLVTQWLKERLLGGKTKQLKVEEYQPDLDAAKPVEIVYDRTGTGREIQLTVGKAQVKAVLDELGLVEKMEMPAGKSTVSGTRAFLRGKP